MNTYDILVIVLSIALGIFLVTAIVLTVGLVKLVKQLRTLTSKAEDIVDDVEAVSGFFRKSAAPVAVTTLISNIVSKMTEHSNKKGKNK